MAAVIHVLTAKRKAAGVAADAQKSGNGFLSHAGLLSCDPESVEILMARSLHTADVRIEKCE